TDINLIINDKELGVKNLGLVFVDFHTGLEQSTVQTAAGHLRKEHVAFASQNELHAAATARHFHEFAADLPRRQEIGDDNFDVARARKVAAQITLEGIAPPARP